jgi:hypothetical protein
MRRIILVLTLLLLAGCSMTSHSFIVPQGTTEADWSVDQRECSTSAQRPGIVPGIVAGTSYEVPVTDPEAYEECMRKKGYKQDGWGWTPFKRSN